LRAYFAILEGTHCSTRERQAVFIMAVSAVQAPVKEFSGLR
jgi:hypothetical protein